MGQKRKTGKNLPQKEKGAVVKKWGGKLTVALVYPNSYFIGMSNLGFQSLYELLNSEDGIVCERFFVHDNEKSSVSVESGRKLSEFDIITFSVSYEEDYINIAKILSFSKIPLFGSERDGRYPLIIGGGAAFFINPEPVADFFDMIWVGYAEAGFVEMLSGLDFSKGKKEILCKAMETKGVYIPSFYKISYNDTGCLEWIKTKENAPIPVKKAEVSNIDTFIPSTFVLTENTEFSSMNLIEIARGCMWGCRFCAAGFIYRPHRNRSFEELIEKIKRLHQRSSKFGFVGASVSDYPYLIDLLKHVDSIEGRGSLSSLRIDTASNTELFSLLKKLGLKTATFAVEAGSERLRKIINKNYTDEEILGNVEKAAKEGILNIKIYFIIGLPFEDESDIRKLISLSKKIRSRFIEGGRQTGRLGNIELSIGNFIPKPFTPFQWMPMERIENLKEKIKVIKKELSSLPNLKLSFFSPINSYIQAFLSRGSRKTALFVKSACEAGGYKKVLKGFESQMVLNVYNKFPVDSSLPWEVVDIGVRKDFLKDELAKAERGVETSECDTSVCRVCGVCS